MDGQERTQFVASYSKLLVAAWSDSELSDRLVHDPKAVLAEFGLGVAADAHVTVVRQIPAEHGNPDVDFQVRLWTEGQESGNYELHVPETPQVDMAELTDSELEGVAGGAIAVGSVGGVMDSFSVSCCCCTPCCSCA